MMTRKHIHVLYCLGFLIFTILPGQGCKSHRSTSMAKAGKGWTISLKKGPCESMCREYQIEVADNGVATFKGIRNVPLIGTFQKRLSEAEIDRISKEIDAENIMEMDEAHNFAAPGGQSVLFSFSHKKQTKTIRYKGNPPPAIRNLILSIESLRGHTDWEAL